jgi:hypothetical protein
MVTRVAGQWTLESGSWARVARLSVQWSKLGGDFRKGVPGRDRSASHFCALSVTNWRSVARFSANNSAPDTVTPCTIATRRAQRGSAVR